MNKLATVIRFTFWNRVRAKSFLVTSLIIVLLLSVAINLPHLISAFSGNSGSKEGMTIGILEDRAGYGRALADHLGTGESQSLRGELLSASSEEESETAAKKKLADGTIEGYVSFGAPANGAFPAVTYKSESKLEGRSLYEVQASLEAFQRDWVVRELGLTPKQAEQLKAPLSFHPVTVGDSGEAAPGKTETQEKVSYFLVYVLIILLFMMMTMYGNLIATEITAEKSSRVMEVLISSISPLTQMFGKVIGMLLLGLAQLLVFVAAAAVNLSVPANQEMIASLGISWSDLPLVLVLYLFVFYLTGFFLYATIYAAVGSLVSRTEDLGQATMPLTFLGLASFYIAIFGINNPDAMFIRIMSYVPFFSPNAMFLRIGLSHPAWWEIALSLVLLLASILFFGWMSAKIYRVGVLMYGKRPSWKEVNKALKAYNG
ncbi:hypothetical protein J31TS4_47290 [Paenibacillus sp. J31TS4]|uniref:ABC transporter permease n=1 Tax=Paenibacillus sp. J31TS4 TaxID=2807195 RepID=UPI001B1A9DE7|nr:ABC transporter permease [Paenibacillus sp. J31TS4]GIP41449.1 hypothetical protein J31TS4_47290 [Paenibacillus sp. J31TS4]